MHAESFPTVERFRGQTVWEGVVEAFDAPKGRVYAFAVSARPEPQYVAVMGGGKIDSPLAAVRACIVSQAKK